MINSIIFAIIMAIPYTIMSTYKQHKINKLEKELDIAESGLRFYKRRYEKILLERKEND